MSYKYQIGEKYKSRNQDQLDKLTDQYINRESFSYNPGADKAFQDYASIMMQSGNKAMRDSTARAASMTGGYGNSYAQSVGQQAYNDFANQIGLAEQQFRNDAYARYNAEGNDLLQKLGLLEQQEARDKSNWENDYANAYAAAQNKATYSGDYGDLAAIMGVDEAVLQEQARRASLKDPSEEQIQGYKDAILNGTAEDYLASLAVQGVYTEDMPELAKMWETSGQIPSESIDDQMNYGKLFTMYDPKPIGLANTSEGQNFHVKNTIEGKDKNWDVQIGKEITDESAAPKKYGKDKEGLFVYNDMLYYADGAGGVFKVTDQNDPVDGDDLTPLINQIKRGVK